MAQRETYLQWSQSERVDILVGTEEDGDVSLRLFRMPMDLLGRRSRTFQVMLDGRFLESATGLIKLPETSIATFQDFYIWALSRSPHIDSEASFEAVADLAILATMYDVVSLQNQAVDVIRSKLSHGEWQLQPVVVERIYQNVGEESTLRQLIKVSLSTIEEPDAFLCNRRTSPEAAEEFIHGWRGIFVKIADIGADFFETTKRGWGRSELDVGGPCRFHDHRGRPVSDDGIETATGCPFGTAECFSNKPDARPREVEFSKKREKKKTKKPRVKVPEEAYATEPAPPSPSKPRSWDVISDNRATG